MEDFDPSDLCTLACTIVHTVDTSKVPLTWQQLEFACIEGHAVWGKESALCDMDIHLDSEKVNLCVGGGVNVSVFVWGVVG